MIFNQGQYSGVSSSRKQLLNQQPINSPSSLTNLNNINNNNNNTINNNLNSPPNINSINKLSKKKSSTINKSQLNLNSQNSKSSLPVNKQSIKSTNLNSKRSLQMTNSKRSLQTTNNKRSIQMTNNKRSYYQVNRVQQFEFVDRIFSNLFNSDYLSFNQLIYALKSIGVQIDTQRRFIQIKSIFDQLRVKNQPIIEYQECVKIGIKLLKQQKNRPNSDLIHLQKAYYHILQSTNNIQIPSSYQINSFTQFKSYINNNYPQLKYLTKQSLNNLIQYLNIQNQFTPSILEDIFNYADQLNKQYLTFQDILTAIQTSQILNQ